MRRNWVFAFFAVLAVLSALGPRAALAQTPNARPAEPAKDHLDRLQNYRTRIMDPQARPEERRNWADALIREVLQVQSDASKDLVVALLSLSSNNEVQRAVCEALAIGNSGNDGRLDARFSVPLMDLLGSPLAELRNAAARALAELPGSDVPARLAALARQQDAPMPKREAAVDALAPNIHRRDVVQQLIGLLDVGTPEIVNRVVTSLEPASREPIGADLARWRSWWAEKSKLSEEAWLSDQVRMYRDRVRGIRTEFDNHRERGKRQATDLTAKLRDFQREIFRIAAPDQRDAKLIEWLGDPLDEVKLTAMAVIKGRIADEGKRPEGETLTALVRLLKEGSPPIRREVLSIVQNLTDPIVAKAVLTALEEEKDPLTREAIFKAVAKLNATDAFSALLREISSPEAPSECVREAALALGQIARLPGVADRLPEAVGPLKVRYQATPPADLALRAGLLSAMAGVADRSFLPEFLEAVDSDQTALLRPAIQGLQTLGDTTKLSRLRRYTGHPDPLIRLAAIEAVGRLGREDSDLESVLARLNPAIEPSELAREAAWRSFRDMLQAKPVSERLRVAALLRDVPDREVEYLTELAGDLASTKNGEMELELIRDRLGNLLLTQGKFAEAVPHLREILDRRNARRDPARLDAGLRLLDASLRSPAFTSAPELMQQLVESAAVDDYVKTRIVETVAQCLDSPETVADPARTQALLVELRKVPNDLLGPSWPKLLQRVTARLEATERGPAAP